MNDIEYFSNSSPKFTDVLFNSIDSDCEIVIVTSVGYYKFIESNDQKLDNLCNIYFPNLLNKDVLNVKSVETYLHENIRKLSDRKKQVTPFFENCQMQFSVYHDNIEKIRNMSKKVSLNLEFIFFTKTDVMFPLHAFFKLVHSSKVFR